MPIDTTDLWPEPDPAPRAAGTTARAEATQTVENEGFVPFDAPPLPTPMSTSSPVASPTHAAPDPASLRDATHQRIAVVLEELALEVEDLGGRLCTDMDVAARHMDVLQAIDLIAQKQRSLARLLEADCPITAIEQIGLDVLRDRMRMFH
ncbi:MULTISPECIES: hypothetical protein [unclassified Novosphingobium]|uniref:hypothetical protein n=1 Tax=unclassified Novosphingobium TaxID=2644732 RepID=UPI000B06F963|nr:MULTISPECIES: hypothetical protein [unclassified Novosphingobium]MBB3359419.1 hypothetical protein [Novosphingobium sp. BK256]MBB3375779.1 hypothetical protein [Novosphingobium sp. BK280]MBB3380192.1 hypothetical protein [Novosphingobium sp. BK258]MBB3421886.1 hypothetical protein [Novosphingobium sp. BK267]MBB3450542.1 hypothetical protein [Novosphingobium sp. BK352]